MDDRLKAIDDYYTNLEYRNNEKKLMEIPALAKEIKFKDVNDFSDRCFKAASIIIKNLSLFQSACEHVDVITTIIEYLHYTGVNLSEIKCNLDEYKKDKKDKKDVLLKQYYDLVLLTVLTIKNTYKKLPMHVFVEDAILTNSVLEITYKRLINKVINHAIEMILLADSDLYAVISYLRNKNFISLLLNKIWIQEPIKEKFLWLVKEYLGISLLKHYSCCIRPFRTKNELFTARVPDKMNIISIWTEDIVFAKNLAISLNRDVLFINTYMDFYGGIVFLPYTFESLHKWHESKLDDCTKKLNVQKSIVYNLFYDGMWQQPVKDTYWIYNNSQWANATSEDVNRCINSAEKGFKIWSTKKTITCRMQILSKFASILGCDGKSALADIISTYTKFSCIYENFLCSQNELHKLEVTEIRTPKGVIILKAEDETVLFHRLMQILIVGNSVIVICNTNSCSLAPYCNMILASEIPPGVINLLSNENIKELELTLCKMDYTSYAEQFFSDSDLKKIYTNLTIPKQIILPLK